MKRKWAVYWVNRSYPIRVGSFLLGSAEDQAIRQQFPKHTVCYDDFCEHVTISL